MHEERRSFWNFLLETTILGDLLMLFRYSVQMDE